ncbi:cytochrome P450 2J6-like isoform X1 [Leptotrombidium deliense]|uniref:Cytochrome P450 2J6-like isoform X1 n=1 Tax=Leptotrombidium deliense TaxID=299467 RepID=A0A443RTB3_9ACAR|nr:cytochrome P450 2J6-like isoform X1 [Leptotrombidium deliense]
MSLPFGIGVRKCSGYKLAEIEIFIAVVRLIRRYEFTLPSENSCDADKLTGNIRHVQPFKVCAKKRQYSLDSLE